MPRVRTYQKQRHRVKRMLKRQLLGQLPSDPELARLCDKGNIERYDSEVVRQLGQSLSQAMTNKEKQETR